MMKEKGIYNIISDEVVLSFYDDYGFIATNKNKFVEIVNEAVLNYKTVNKNFKKRIENALDKYICDILAGNDINAVKLVCRYIDDKVVTLNTTEKNKLNFIGQFFTKYLFFNNLDFNIELLNNSDNLNYILEMFLSLKLSHDKLSSFLDESVVRICDAYYIINSLGKNDDTEQLDGNNDEIDLTNVDLVGAYLDALPSTLLTFEEEKQIAYRILNGDKEAKKILVEKNLRYVVKIAKRYVNLGLPFMDLIQEGNLGLMEAADRYDVTLGYRFTTYATWWIKQSIKRALSTYARCIRLPEHKIVELQKFNQIQKELISLKNGEPDIKKIAEEMELSEEKVIQLKKLQLDVVSLNEKVGEEEESDLIDFIPSKDLETMDVALKNILTDEIMTLFEKCKLSQIEMEILILRYGFFNKEAYTLDKIAKLKGKTRQRIDQIEKRALIKIRKSPYIKEFSVYMDNPDKAIRNIDKFNDPASCLNYKNVIRPLNDKNKQKLKK